MRPLDDKSRLAKSDKSLIAKIRKAGAICRDTYGKCWIPDIGRVAPESFDRLVHFGLIEATGDSLFDTPSQTWKIKEDQCSKIR